MRSTLLSLILVLFLALSSPVLADGSLSNSAFSIGQRVVWNYRVRANSEEVREIPAEVVKLGSKRVLIKIRQKNGGLITRWVGANKLKIPEK